MARPRDDLVPSMISFKKLFDSALLRQSLVKDLSTSRVGILIIPRLPPRLFRSENPSRGIFPTPHKHRPLPTLTSLLTGRRLRSLA